MLLETNLSALLCRYAPYPLLASTQPSRHVGLIFFDIKPVSLQMHLLRAQRSVKPLYNTPYKQTASHSFVNGKVIRWNP